MFRCTAGDLANWVWEREREEGKEWPESSRSRRGIGGEKSGFGGSAVVVGCWDFRISEKCVRVLVGYSSKAYTIIFYCTTVRVE